MTDPREVIPDAQKTVLTRLTDAMVQALRDAPYQSPNLPNDPTFDGVKLFDFVDYGVLDDIAVRETPAARFEIGTEDIVELMWPITQKTARVYVHFKVVKAIGVDPRPLIHYYFGRITEILVTPEHFADIALDISEAGNSAQAQGQNDPEPGGSIYYDVEFRHGFGNYFSETGNHD